MRVRIVWRVVAYLVALVSATLTYCYLASHIAPNSSSIPLQWGFILVSVVAAFIGAFIVYLLHDTLA